MDPFDDIYLSEEAARRAGIPIARAFGRATLRITRSLWHELGAIAGMADAWYKTHRMWHQNHPSVDRPPPSDEDVPGDTIVVDGSYQGMAHGIRGLVGPDTYLGRGFAAHPVALTVREHGVRRALRYAGPRGPPGSPAITRSMTRAAKRAGEFMESPRVRRTAEGIWRHTTFHYEPPTTRSRARVSIRHHPYRAVAHALGFGHIAHAIP